MLVNNTQAVELIPPFLKRISNLNSNKVRMNFVLRFVFKENRN